MIFLRLRHIFIASALVGSLFVGIVIPIKIQTSTFSITYTHAPFPISNPEKSTASSSVADRNYYAIVVGIADYPGTLNDLNYCADDAVAVNHLLVENFYFPLENVHLLLDENASKLSIRNAFNSLKGTTSNQDVIILYFSGHGHQDSNGEYLTPFDGLMNPKIADGELNDWINELSFYRFVMVLDACYSGGIVENITNPNVIALSACAKGELSYETATLMHGVFTYYFLDSFTRNTSQDYLHDTNGDGSMALVDEVFDHANSTSRSYYLGYNITVNPQLKSISGQDMVLDWQMQIAGLEYFSSTRSLRLMMETNRTRTFNLSISYAPCEYVHPSPGSWFVHGFIVEPLTFPIIVPLEWLDAGMNYALVINQSVQNQSILFTYNPYTADFDGDGIPDGVEWELPGFYNPSDPTDGILDHDGDGLTIYDEWYRYHTNPLSRDSDSDLFDDGVEVQLGTDPSNQIDSPFTRFLLVAIIVVCPILILLFKHKRKNPGQAKQHGKIQPRKRVQTS